MPKLVLAHALGVERMRRHIVNSEAALRAQFTPPLRLGRTEWDGDRLLVEVLALSHKIPAIVWLHGDRIEIAYELPWLLRPFETVVTARIRTVTERLLVGA